MSIFKFRITSLGKSSKFMPILCANPRYRFCIEPRCVWYRTTVFNRYYQIIRIRWILPVNIYLDLLFHKFTRVYGFLEYVTYDTTKCSSLGHHAILRVTIIGTHHLRHRFMVVCFCIRTDNIKCHNFPSGCNPYHLIFLN